MDGGVVRNISVMACGPFVEEAAQMLSHRKDICFGMHITLNAEWDRVKWKPVEQVMKDVEAQLERLCRLGFDIRYVDSHMFSEACIERMDEAMAEFARKKGLVDHMYFYRLLPRMQMLFGDLQKAAKELLAVPQGQCFIVVHPSLYTKRCCLRETPG